MPHTDTPKKLITPIVSAMRAGEWDPAFGGGTKVNRTNDTDDAFDWLNKTVPFEKIDVLDVTISHPTNASPSLRPSTPCTACVRCWARAATSCARP